MIDANLPPTVAQCCANCRWSMLSGGEYWPKNSLWCRYTLTHAVPDSIAIGSVAMNPRAGTECPCWEPKENP